MSPITKDAPPPTGLTVTELRWNADRECFQYRFPTDPAPPRALWAELNAECAWGKGEWRRALLDAQTAFGRPIWWRRYNDEEGEVT